MSILAINRGLGFGLTVHCTEPVSALEMSILHHWIYMQGWEAGVADAEETTTGAERSADGGRGLNDAVQE